MIFQYILIPKDLHQLFEWLNETLNKNGNAECLKLKTRKKNETEILQKYHNGKLPKVKTRMQKEKMPEDFKQLMKILRDRNVLKYYYNNYLLRKVKKWKLDTFRRSKNE